jgi:serine protease inhibitor ecotin
MTINVLVYPAVLSLMLAAAPAITQETRTLKERLSDKASDNQRVAAYPQTGAGLCRVRIARQSPIRDHPQLKLGLLIDANALQSQSPVVLQEDSRFRWKPFIQQHLCKASKPRDRGDDGMH